MSRPLNAYERRRRAELIAWRNRAPDWFNRQTERVSAPALDRIEKLVPESAVIKALAASQKLALRLSDERRLLKRAGVGHLHEMHALPLEICDQLARRLQRQSLAVAAGTGAAGGLAGILGTALDIPALLTLSLRCIHRTGLCYGYGSGTPLEQNHALGIFALASANNAQEKQASLLALDRLHMATDQSLRKGIERVARRELAKDVATVSLQTLASRIGVNLGTRKAAAAVPVVGMVIGGSVNAWYMRDIARCAQFSFLARRLTDMGHNLDMDEINPMSQPPLQPPASV